MKNPKPSSQAARNRMLAQRQRDTTAELKIRRLLHRRGLRYRVDYVVIAKPRRRADIAFPRAKVAVFVDGCFWHGCPRHGTSSKSNARFWKDKIDTNRKRDKDTSTRLRKMGWGVVRAWEHENPNKVADKIERIVMKRMAD